jgi:hypothetical protein
MHWTWTNLIVTVIGAVVIVGCSFLIKYRVAVQSQIVRQNTAMYGRRWGARMARTPVTMGVVVPAVFGIVIGSVFVAVGIFGHPH